MIKSGVFAVYEGAFKVGKTAEALSPIADMETYSVSIDDGVEEWTPLNTEGWIKRLKTAKSLKVTVSGKRNLGDTGNDFVAGLTFTNGKDSEGIFEWTIPDGTDTGTIVSIPCVFLVTNIGTGDSTKVAPLEFEVDSNGKPTVTVGTKTVG